MTTMFASKIAL